MPLTLTGSTQILDSSYEFSVVDSNSLPFLFKHAREAAEQLQIGSGYSFETSRQRWLVSYSSCCNSNNVSPPAPNILMSKSLMDLNGGMAFSLPPLLEVIF